MNQKQRRAQKEDQHLCTEHPSLDISICHYSLWRQALILYGRTGGAADPLFL